MNPRSVFFILPFAVFLALVVLLGYRLRMIDQGNLPNLIPSVMINRPAPAFDLPSLFDGGKHFIAGDLKGKVTLIDVFASWCEQCQIEHPLLGEIKEAGIVLAGIDYKDQPQAARAWLAKLGNPYDVIGSDRDGRVAIDFGVYGAPESYLIDKQGIIRFKQTGPLTEEVIRQTILPLAKELNK